LNGQHFEVDGNGSFVIMHQLSRVYQRVREKLHEQLKSVVADEERAAELRAMFKSLRNYDNVAAVNSTMAVMQGVLYAPDLFERLNTDLHMAMCATVSGNSRWGRWTCASRGTCAPT
jgi:hypothetical protein